MDDTIRGLYEVILERKEHGEEGSYTAYLFDKGIDKILKKVGEESTEVVIASKNLHAFENDTAKLAAVSTEPVSDNIDLRTDSALSDADLRADLKNEICDLIYHLLVMMAQQSIPVDEVMEILEDRRKKSGNLKEQKIVDKNT